MIFFSKLHPHAFINDALYSFPCPFTFAYYIISCCRCTSLCNSAS